MGKLGQTARQHTLTSRDNRWLKRFRAALRGSVRPGELTTTGDETLAGGAVGVEGLRLVEEALRSGLVVEAVLVSASGACHLERLARWIDPGVRLLRTTDRLFAGVADTQSPQGVAALVRPRAASFDDIARSAVGTAPLVVVLVGVQDPGNVGTILRAAEALGATGVAACASPTSGTANPLAPKALRASAGSALRLPVVQGVALTILLVQLRVAGVKLYAACSEHSRGVGPQAILRPWEADLRGPTALLVGNEGAGLPLEVERAADARVSIPLAAGVDSLNAAMAASVLLYEATRQRKFR